MRESITGYSIANDIMMSSYKGNYLIVEGDTDRRLFKKFIIRENCIIKNAFCRTNAVKSIEILNQFNFKHALTIVDTDFTLLENCDPPDDNLFLTDTNDLETMILKSTALEHLIEEYCSSNKLSNFEKTQKKKIRDLLLDNGKFIGHFRWYCKKKNIQAKFKNLPIKDCMNRKLLIVFTKLKNEIIKNSNNLTFTVNNEKELLNEIHTSQFDLWMLCNGHDLIEILLIWLNNKIGRVSRLNSLKVMQKEDLEAIMRLTYSLQAFKTSKLYADIKNWEIKTNNKILN